MLPYTNKRSDPADQPNIPKMGNRLLQQKQQATSQIAINRPDKQGREEQATTSNQQPASHIQQQAKQQAN
jgi:hypothetical protein